MRLTSKARRSENGLTKSGPGRGGTWILNPLYSDTILAPVVSMLSLTEARTIRLMFSYSSVPRTTESVTAFVYR